MLPYDRFHTATEDSLSINLMQGISDELMQVNARDDIYRWWEVIDRTTGEVVPTDNGNSFTVSMDANEIKWYDIK